MGLFDFLKKDKKSDQPVLQSLPELDLNSDLPSIRGANIPPVSENVPFSLTQNPLPAPDSPLQNFESSTNKGSSISVNIPTLDFSLPPSDDSTSLESFNTSTSSLDSKPIAPSSSVSSSVSPEDLQKLFISDGWKEPDWSKFEPYENPVIDEPKSEDFSVPKDSDLPFFDEDNKPIIPQEKPSEVKRTIKPIELFIRGSSYNKVFYELDAINKQLSTQDSKISSYEDIVKQDESMINSAKEQTEFIYKKLMQIDKKIFT